jgi:hypothetical protein
MSGKTRGSRFFLWAQGLFLLILFSFGLHFHLKNKAHGSTLLVQNNAAALNWTLKNKVLG